MAVGQKLVMWNCQPRLASLVSQMAKNLPAMWETRSTGKGNGNPLQYSCLENSMDIGAWRATVHGVAQSQTGLSMHARQPRLASWEPPLWAASEPRLLGGALCAGNPSWVLTGKQGKQESSHQGWKARRWAPLGGRESHLPLNQGKILPTPGYLQSYLWIKLNIVPAGKGEIF